MVVKWAITVQLTSAERVVGDKKMKQINIEPQQLKITEKNAHSPDIHFSSYIKAS
jgi:hypothetical protein